MNATQYFKRMTLDELVNWYNENVAVKFDGPFNMIMPYNEETLRRIADYCGMVQYTKMVVSQIHAAYTPSYIFYDVDNGIIRTYDGKNKLLDDFEDAMCDEYEFQEIELNEQ